jgi:hypothetical protein
MRNADRLCVSPPVFCSYCAPRTPHFELVGAEGFLHFAQMKARTPDILLPKQDRFKFGNAHFTDLFFSASYGRPVEVCGSVWF